MKKICTLILSTSLFFDINAGVSIGDPVILGSVKQVHNNIHNNPAQLIINDHARYSTIITQINDEFICGTLKDYPNSHFNLSVDNGKLSGFVVISDDLVYEYSTNSQNEVVVQQVSMNDILCTDYAKDDIIENQKQNFISAIENKVLSSAAGAIPAYQSRPGSQNVLYLDFDGHTLASNNYWVINNGAPTTIAASGYTDTQMWQTWSVVSEDYAPFDVNVTTDSNIFNNAAAGKKMRMALTTTSSWKPGAGGVTVSNIFPKTNISYYHPAWVFVDKMGGSAQNAGECASHEFGHTLSLHHDGTELVVEAPEDTLSYATTYYKGHGYWGPIMGSSYKKAISQFSKGEYDYANNTSEDDITLITKYLPFVNDTHGDDIANATELMFTMNDTNGIVDSVSNNGIINHVTDLDAFHFYTGGGTLTLNVIPSANLKTNLDVEVKLYNSSSTLVGTFNTAHNNYTIKGITISQQLPPDSYFITVDGTGSGSPITGWSDYNSMGPYYITGTIPNADQTTRITSANNTNTTVYPNPIGNNNMLYFTNTMNNISVYDLSGQIINSASKSSQIHLGSDIAEGMYFIEFTNNGERILSKVIK